MEPPALAGLAPYALVECGAHTKKTFKMLFWNDLYSSSTPFGIIKTSLPCAIYIFNTQNIFSRIPLILLQSYTQARLMKLVYSQIASQVCSSRTDRVSSITKNAIKCCRRNFSVKYCLNRISNQFIKWKLAFII